MNLNKLKPIFLTITFLVGFFFISFCIAFAAKEDRTPQFKAVLKLNCAGKSKKPSVKKRKAKISKRRDSYFQRIMNSSLPIDRIGLVKEWIEKHENIFKDAVIPRL